MRARACKKRFCSPCSSSPVALFQLALIQVAPFQLGLIQLALFQLGLFQLAFVARPVTLARFIRPEPVLFNRACLETLGCSLALGLGGEHTCASQILTAIAALYQYGSTGTAQTQVGAAPPWAHKVRTVAFYRHWRQALP